MSKAKTFARLPRGLRNNNPGNIRHGSSAWRGMSEFQEDPAFVQFDKPEYGLRALGILLRVYHSKRGLKTIRAIIGRYAPQIENDTSSYVDHVAKSVGVTPDEPFELTREIAVKLMQAIVMHENGKNPFATPAFTKAASQAGIAV